MNDTSKEKLKQLEGSLENGWGVARNPLKVLNHLSLAVEKNQIANQMRTLSSLSDLSDEMVSQYLKVNHLEFHPTDLCNLRCQGCTYGHDVYDIPKVHFPFSGLSKLQAFSPKSILIAGGGEPTLYRSEGKRFPDVVEELGNLLPGVKLALITNGVFKPDGKWINRFDWIRISLDAASPAVYSNFRGEPFFDRVIGNFLQYLMTDVRYVGLGFVFSRTNMADYVELPRFIYDTVMKNCPEAISKVNIQYRPLRHDPPNLNDASLFLTREDIERIEGQLLALTEERPDLVQFVREQTNILSFLDGNVHKPREFSRCHYAEIFKIIRADGGVRPCCVGSLLNDLHLGSLFSDDLRTIAWNTFRAAEKDKASYCNASQCRMCKVSHTVEKGLLGELSPSRSEEVQADYMF